MKQDKNTIRTETKPGASDVCRWVQTLFRLHERLAPRFARPEPYRRVLAYLQGMAAAKRREKTAGNELNTQEKPVPMACNVCSRKLSGTPMAYAMIYVPMSLSNWACSCPSWSSTKVAFPSEAKNRLVLACSIAEPLAGSRIVRSESFSRM